MQQKVQTQSIARLTDEQRAVLIEEYRDLGFTTETVGDELICYWGVPEKKKIDKKRAKAEEPEHKPGQEKTARRLGR
jgi:hypothetical protein